MAATWEDVSAIARTLPRAEAGVRVGEPVWRIGKNVFVWVRPLRARDHVDPERLREVVTDAWLARAPKRLAAAYLSGLDA